MPGDENLVPLPITLIQNGLAGSEKRHSLLNDIQQDVGIQKKAHLGNTLKPVLFLIMSHADVFLGFFSPGHPRIFSGPLPSSPLAF